MNLENQSQTPTPEAPDYSVPWRPMDNWLGVLLLALIDLILLVITLRGLKTQVAQSALVVVLELIYLLPVAVILGWRRISWKALGFGKFRWDTLGLGCGLLIIGYILIIVHNLILFFFGVDTQGNQIVKMFSELQSPAWFFFVGAIVAPIVEETFFRGFLFQGFRGQYGWKVAMPLSAGIFAAAHLDLVAFIPVFILGNVLAYVYHRSNSVWPGIILHFLVNAFGLFGAYFASHYQNFIPS